MADQQASTSALPRKLWGSVAAVFSGMLVVIVLSLATDQVLHVLNVYPPWGQGMHEPSLNLLALVYRCVFNVSGAYLVARMAPRNPALHLWVFATMGFALGSIGALATLPLKLGPAWYPILLAISAFPCSWLAWVLYRARRGGDAALE